MKNKIDDKLYEVIKDYLTVRGEGGIIQPEHDDIVSLQDAIYDHYKIKELQHFKDSSIGLYCMDKKPEDIFFQLK